MLNAIKGLTSIYINIHPLSCLYLSTINDLLRNVYILAPSLGLKPNWLHFVTRTSDNLYKRIVSTTFERILAKAIRLTPVGVHSPSRADRYRFKRKRQLCNVRVWWLWNPQFHNGQLCNVYKGLCSPHKLLETFVFSPLSTHCLRHNFHRT